MRDRDLIKEAAAIRARATREGDSLSLIERTAVQEGSESGKVWCKRERGSGAATREAITAAARRSVVRSYKVKEGRREGAGERGPLALWLARLSLRRSFTAQRIHSFLPPPRRYLDFRRSVYGGEGRGKALLAAKTNKYQRGPGNGGRMIELSPE